MKPMITKTSERFFGIIRANLPPIKQHRNPSLRLCGAEQEVSAVQQFVISVRKHRPCWPLRRLFALSIFLPATLAGLATASAQSAGEYALVLEEVIVTAQKREENLQDVPVSVIALDGEQLARKDLVTLEDLQAYVPNFYLTETLLGPMLQIRGIGSGVNQGFEQSVGLYVDGVYHGRAQQSRLAMLDVERVEVLRGPQSTLFGFIFNTTGALTLVQMVLVL
jgi:outer membrane receptor protein involved in Fe transport